MERFNVDRNRMKLDQNCKNFARVFESFFEHLIREFESKTILLKLVRRKIDMVVDSMLQPLIASVNYILFLNGQFLVSHFLYFSLFNS